MTDRDLQELLDTPETEEERRALDALERDPAELLELARRRVWRPASSREPAPKTGTTGARSRPS